MIKLQREKIPATLKRNVKKWTQELLDAIEQHKPKKAPDRYWNKYRKTEVKKALQAMSHDKCAYCESKISHLDYGHIEHYRPKSRYPHLTFAWENLLLACAICNGAEHKGDRFPLKDGDETQPLLLNPCDDNPADHLELFEARLVPLTERGKVTCDLMGLNRDALFDQRRERYILLLGISLFVKKCEAEGDIESAQRWRLKESSLREC